tara:strand:- start:430 stop:966 length:537 start_codon:yes stop_codon:yes gene_type:complete
MGNISNIKFLKKFIIVLLSLSLLYLNSCGLYEPTDARKVSPNADERVKQNQAEGKGFTLLNSRKNKGGTFQFASSNPLWRASLDILDFMPIINASYSGGIIITDWYDENDSKNSVKITVKFLSNEIRPDGLEVLVYKKNCKSFESCQSKQQDGKINSELKFAILKKAAQIKKANLVKK